VAKTKITEGRRLAKFSSFGTPVERQECQGWNNPATWCFNLYFTQEEKLVNTLLSLIGEDGNINYHAAVRLFDNAQRGQFGYHMEQIDADNDGLVDVEEIVNNFLSNKGEKRDGTGRCMLAISPRRTKSTPA